MLDLISSTGVSRDEQEVSHFAAGCQVWFLVDEDHQINSFRDKLLLRSGGRLGDETLQPDEAADGIIRVDCGHPTGMTRVPRLQQAGLRKRCDSQLEGRWLDLLDAQLLRAPSDCQFLIESCSTRPDFYYQENNAAIYI